MSSLADCPEIVGFFSYSREDDEAYTGRLSALREAIQHELGAQLGRSRTTFRLWQDKEAIAPGRLWESEIRTAVQQSVFFIPIVTPRVVNSQYCQFEFQAFLAREHELGRSDLIFPILYIPVPALANEAQWRANPILKAIAERQYVDWQTFRFSDVHTPAIREAIGHFARKIVEALNEPWLSADERRRQEEVEAERGREEEWQRREADARRRADEAKRQADEDAHRETERAEQERLAAERRQQDIKSQRAAEAERRKQAEIEARRRTDQERAVAAANAADSLSAGPWRPSRRVIVAGGAAAAAGVVGIAAFLAGRTEFQEPPAAPTTPAPSTPPIQPTEPTLPTKVRIGVLTDMSSIYSDFAGQGSVVAARLAIADFAKQHPNVSADLVSADHLNKPDVGAAIAKQWFERDGVDMIIDVPNSGVAFAVRDVAAERNKLLIVSGGASADLTGARCNANTIHWTYDTWMLANAMPKGMVRGAADTCFFITADYAFGHALEQDVRAAVEKQGGKVLGAVRHPINTSDFSSYLLQAQASKAKFIVLANAGGDTINSVRQAGEFGIAKGGQKLVGLLVYLTDTQGLGLQAAQGLTLSETWYWDANDANRDWTRRWQQERPGKFPTMVHAGVYSGMLHYLKAYGALGGTPDGTNVAGKMKSLPTDDPLFGKGIVRSDGRKLHDAYVFEVKPPSASRYPGDYYVTKATIPAQEAFRPLSAGGCSLARG